MSNRAGRGTGAIYTPPDFARFLTDWAVQDPDQRVLDIGVGEGVFVFAAYQRLVALGADPQSAGAQVYGAEIDLDAFGAFCRQAKSATLCFPHVYHSDFFALDLPSVGAVIGNPPYVRRTYIEGLDAIRRSVLEQDPSMKQLLLRRATDLYVYFLLRAMTALQPGGRLAVITADPWLNVGYGAVLKDYLKQHFIIDSLISLDRRVFDDAQVKPVLLLAMKHSGAGVGYPVRFVRVKNGLPIGSLQRVLDGTSPATEDVVQATVERDALHPTRPWGVYFKAPDLYEQLAAHPQLVPVASLANTRVGLQTLAKNFFVLPVEQARIERIEPEFLRPLAQSLRYQRTPVIAPGQKPKYQLFYCNRNKESLQGTHTLAYIIHGEATEVPVRGKGMTVVGYDQKERIQRSHRKHWYDLQTDLERRGCASILIPRLLYRDFMVVWNRAEYVPGELFIEFLPLPSDNVDLEAYLAVLTSSAFEVMVRNHAQVYGGGTYNVNPGQIKKVPMLNVPVLATTQQEDLKRAYRAYLADEHQDRSAIDDVVATILGFTSSQQQQLAEVRADLVIIATASKQAASSHREGIEE